MWSYSAPDRMPHPPAAPPCDGEEQVARHHQPPTRRASKLRLVKPSVTDIHNLEEETS
ncbi:MAG: hypothetical protein QOI06_325 [Nocardioidaceae bacterium]|jgi:hypothetical protein|nr:hypothetical protein [Nocardioidaceae bacterium]